MDPLGLVDDGDLSSLYATLVLVKTTHSHNGFVNPPRWHHLLPARMPIDGCSASQALRCNKWPRTWGGSPWRSKSSNLFPVLLATYGRDVATSHQLSSTMYVFSSSTFDSAIGKQQNNSNLRIVLLVTITPLLFCCCHMALYNGRLFTVHTGWRPLFQAP